MNKSWMTPCSVALVLGGIAAALNLMRVFMRDWREGRGEVRRGSFPRERSESVGAPARAWMMLRRMAAIALVSGFGARGAQAQEAAATPQPEPASPAPSVAAEPGPAAAAKSPYSLQFNLDYTTAYFYHGIIQEDTGLILQPAAKLTINLHESEGFKVDAFFATWNSFHGQKTAASTSGEFSEYWYESDLIGGVALTMGEVSLSTQYVFLTSPSDAYETVEELDFTLAYDDSEQLGKFALHPYALLAIETGADASDGANSDTGTYLELGIAPGFSFDIGQTAVAVTFPASVGLSLKDYYQNAAGEDDTFGFAQIGVKASVPLPLGERYGQWTLNAGVSAMFLGDHTAEFNGDDSEQMIATVGLQLNF